MKVVALFMGYYGSRIQEVGEVFEIDPAHFSVRWMQPLSLEDLEKVKGKFKSESDKEKYKELVKKLGKKSVKVVAPVKDDDQNPPANDLV